MLTIKTDREITSYSNFQIPTLLSGRQTFSSQSISLLLTNIFHRYERRYARTRTPRDRKEIAPADSTLSLNFAKLKGNAKQRNNLTELIKNLADSENHNEPGGSMPRF